jgi:hypothetical protein
LSETLSEIGQAMYKDQQPAAEGEQTQENAEEKTEDKKASKDKVEEGEVVS